MEKENKSGKSHVFRITLNHVKSRITGRSNFRQFTWYELLNFTFKTELIHKSYVDKIMAVEASLYSELGLIMTP